MDWAIEIDPSASGEALSPALLGHYDLSGELLDYESKQGLVPFMQTVGFSDWRVGVGRWEASTRLLPTLSDGSPCPIFHPESAAPAGFDDLALIASRDWFTDDGLPVLIGDTDDDARYSLAYFRSVLDVVDAFGATPFVSIDSMPRALAANETPLRDDCDWTFKNQVSNVSPESAPVFAAAVAGMVERIVEGSDGQPARPVTHWEVWNEPEFPEFWDPAFELPLGTLNRYFDMSISTLVALAAYRTSSLHPNATDLAFGLGSFGTTSLAVAVLMAFDSVPIPGGFVPIDFLSFHAYSNDPLVVVATIDAVANAAASTSHYSNIELVLGEWGPNLMDSAGDPIYAASIQPALHIGTVLALGASAGLDRAHRAIFWDFYPNSIRLGLLDHDLNPRSAYRAYELLSSVIVEGATRVSPIGIPDGRLDAGMGAVLVSRDTAGVTRVLLVNRNLSGRSTEIAFGGVPQAPTRVLIYSDPSAPISEMVGMSSTIVVPAESLVMLEFAPTAVPTLNLFALLLLGGFGGALGRRLFGHSV